MIEYAINTTGLSEDDVRRAQDAFAAADGLCTVCGLPLPLGWYPCIKTIRVHEPAHVATIGDAIDEYNEMVDDKVIHYTSRTERRKDLDRRGLVEYVRHVGMPGSDKSPRTSRWV